MNARKDGRMPISFGDNVRIVSTPLTVSLGFAGLTGAVYGQTTPSVTGVEVIGEIANNCAINVNLSESNESFWFAPELLEFVDHAPGTEMSVGDKKFVRSADGEWIAVRLADKAKPWWRFW